MKEQVPKRIQRKRTKGWRKPEGAVDCTRPGRWGNPFTVKEYGRDLAIFNYRQRMRNLKLVNPSAFDELIGKDLMCFCPLYDNTGRRILCHADILLSIANDIPMEEICAPLTTLH
jgi:hypothetical protein